MSVAMVVVCGVVGMIGWLATIAITMHVREVNKRVLDSHDLMLRELVGLKNPWVQQAVETSMAPPRRPIDNGDWPRREALQYENEEVPI